MKTYTFHVSIPGTGRVWRKIEMQADQTLEQLHWAIQRAYEWGGDHLYSFFMSGKAWDSSTEYCLPEDAYSGDDFFENEEGEEEIEPDPEFTPEKCEALLREVFGDSMTIEEMRAEIESLLSNTIAAQPGDVRETTLASLELDEGQKFMYLFDYGDEWRFKVRVHAINPDAPEDEYPQIVESVGEAPSQYPDWDDM